MAAVFQAEEFPQPGGAEDVQRRGHAESNVRLVAQQKGDPRAIYLCYDTRKTGLRRVQCVKCQSQSYQDGQTV